MRQELGELGDQLAQAQRELALSVATRSELEDMVLAARVAKLDTEKQLADMRAKIADQEEKLLHSRDDAKLNRANLENAVGELLSVLRLAFLHLWPDSCGLLPV